MKALYSVLQSKGDQGEAILTYLPQSCLDSTTLKELDCQVNTDTVSTFDELVKFVEKSAC